MEASNIFVRLSPQTGDEFGILRTVMSFFVYSDDEIVVSVLIVTDTEYFGQIG